MSGKPFEKGNNVGIPFAKGVSGNPGGAPKGIVRKMRETHKDDLTKIMAAMVAIAVGTAKDSDRVRAAEFVFDRLLGKAPQTIDATITDNASVAPAFDWSRVPLELRRQLLAVMQQPESEPEPDEPATEH